MSNHHSIPGLPNFRDIGNQPVSSPPLRIIRPGIVFRSAALSHLTPEGGSALSALGITAAYDLRSAVEIQRHDGDDPSATLPAGIKRVAVPVFEQEDYSPEAIALRYRAYAAEDTTAGFVEAYKAILRAGGPAFGAVLEALASPSPAPLLVHCTAGKDRTGVLCAIILSLCGVDDAAVAAEYGLTESGLADLRPMMIEKLLENPALQGNREGVVRMTSSKPESMLATLALLRKEYGSVQDYVVKQCRISPEAIARLRQNLIVDAPANREDGKVSRPSL